MAGAKFIDNDIIEANDLQSKAFKKRPTTSGYRGGGGDRLPSRSTKTRKMARRIQIGMGKPTKKEKVKPKKKNLSPQNSNLAIVNNRHQNGRKSLHTALPSKNKKFEEYKEDEFLQNPHFEFRERMNGKSIILEEHENYEEDQEPSREVFAL